MTPADIDRLLELDRCPRCNCHSYARVDERQPGGSFGPGPEVRCVNCKHVWRNLVRPLAEQARRVPELEGDARTLRGYIATYGETPSMTASSRAHWKKRAEKAEAELAAAREEIARLIENCRSEWDEVSDLSKELAAAREENERLRKLLAEIAPEMRREHDAGDGHFSTKQVEQIERAALAKEPQA